MITARWFRFYLLWKHIGVGVVCNSKISIIVHIIQLNHGIPGWLRWEETSGCHLDSLQYLCVSLALGSPGLDAVLYVWLEQGGRISCLDLLPSPSSPESCQPSLTQGHFAGSCSALATQLWHISLSSSLLSLASSLRTNSAPSSRPWTKMLNRTGVFGLQLDFVPLLFVTYKLCEL